MKRERAGFTLAEVAVTIALVGIVLAWLLQSLSASKISAAHARDLKLAREIALATLGRIESGLYEDDLDNERIEGRDEDHPTFEFEAVIGEQNFAPDPTDQRAFDNWRAEQAQRERDQTNAEEEEEEDAEQPYEKIQIKVTFPKIQELPNTYVLEKWVPWVVLHPPSEDDEAADDGDPNSNGDSNSGDR